MKNRGEDPNNPGHFRSGEKMGRPPRPIDWDVFEKLCKIQCTTEELAGFLEMDFSGIVERVEKHYGMDFPTVYKRFAAGGKASLRRTQFALAQKNSAMAIWLGKNHLNQSEPKFQVEHSGGVQVEKVVYEDEPMETEKGDRGKAED